MRNIEKLSWRPTRVKKRKPVLVKSFITLSLLVRRKSVHLATAARLLGLWIHVRPLCADELLLSCFSTGCVVQIDSEALWRLLVCTIVPLMWVHLQEVYLAISPHLWLHWSITCSFCLLELSNFCFSSRTDKKCHHVLYNPAWGLGLYRAAKFLSSTQKYSFCEFIGLFRLVYRATTTKKLSTNFTKKKKKNTDCTVNKLQKTLWLTIFKGEKTLLVPEENFLIKELLIAPLMNRQNWFSNEVN